MQQKKFPSTQIFQTRFPAPQTLILPHLWGPPTLKKAGMSKGATLWLPWTFRTIGHHSAGHKRRKRKGRLSLSRINVVVVAHLPSSSVRMWTARSPSRRKRRSPPSGLSGLETRLHSQLAARRAAHSTVFVAHIAQHNERRRARDDDIFMAISRSASAAAAADVVKPAGFGTPPTHYFSERGQSKQQRTHTMRARKRKA